MNEERRPSVWAILLTVVSVAFLGTSLVLLALA